MPGELFSGWASGVAPQNGKAFLAQLAQVGNDVCGVEMRESSPFKRRCLNKALKIETQTAL